MTTQHISERAMLIKVSIHQWTARRNDKRVSAEVAQRHGSDATMGAYQKDLVARDALKEISELSSQIRATLHELTLPWLDDGARILPSAFYFKAMEALKALIHKRDEKVSDFLAKWDTIVADARVRLNGLFDEADYPSPARLRRAFAVDMTVFPMPAGDDFRVPLGSEEAAAVQEHIDTRVNELLEAATRDVWQRVHEVVSRMVDRLKAYQVDPETKKVISTFRDSLVDNIRDLVELLPGLNVAGSADLDQMTTRLRDGLTVYDAQDLRDDEGARNTVIDRAEAILADLSDFIA